MLLSIHQNTSRAAGYLGSLEGWAKAGIQYVELSDNLLERDSSRSTRPRATPKTGHLWTLENRPLTGRD